jgi:hypothetical protein
VKRLLVAALALVASAAGSFAPDAAAGTECRGLQSCIRVVGTWVQVAAGPASTSFHLACPGRGQTVGGLDVDKAGRAVDVTFLGATGGPISPGVTTGREIVFVARATARTAVTFRPRLGCIPAAGGGGRSRTAYEPRRKLTAYAAAAPTVVRRARTVRLPAAGEDVASFACRSGETLLAASSAIAFRTTKAPTLARLTSVRSFVVRTGRRAQATVRGRPPAGVRVVLQIQLVCAR